MSKEKIERAIRKVKFKDASSHTMGPYCKPYVEMAREVNLEMYMNSLSEDVFHMMET